MSTIVHIRYVLARKSLLVVIVATLFSLTGLLAISAGHELL